MKNTNLMQVQVQRPACEEVKVMAQTEVSGEHPMTKILTTHHKRYHPLWSQKTVLLPGWQEELERAGSRPLGIWRDLYWGWKLFRASRHFDAVVTGSERPSHVFAMLQALTRRRKKTIVHVFIDFPWNPPTASFLLALKRLQYWLEASAIARIVVLGGPEEVHGFAKALRLPPDKFVFLPYHTTTYDVEVHHDGEYIFSGGDYTRDYATLIEGTRGLAVPVVIAARLRHYFDGLEIPENVKILTVNPKEFDQLMAGAKLVVIPLNGGLLHAGGHTVLLNAMAFGKPVVIAEDGMIKNYVTPGVTAVLVPPGDPKALNNAIRTLLDNPAQIRSLGESAKAAAAEYSPEHFFERVFALIHEALQQRRDG